MKRTLLALVAALAFPMTATPGSAQPSKDNPVLVSRPSGQVAVNVDRKVVDEGDEITIAARIKRAGSVRRVILEQDAYAYDYEAGRYDYVFAEVDRAPSRGRSTVKFHQIASGPDLDRYRVGLELKNGQVKYSRAVSVQVWRWIALREFAPYEGSRGSGFGEGTMNGALRKAWGPYTYSDTGAWFVRFTPGRHCDAFRGVMALFDTSDDGTDGYGIMSADDQVVFTSPTLTPGMDVPFEVALGAPYRFSIEVYDNDRADALRAWPGVGDPALHCRYADRGQQP